MIPCDDQPLVEFLHGTLDRNGEDALAEHLAGCEPCRERLLVMDCLDTLHRSTLRPRLKYRRAGWASAALLVLSVALALVARTLLPGETDCPNLATLEKPAEFPLRTRSGKTEETIRREALHAFARDDFLLAEQLLSALPDEPENLFYRGVSLYLLEEIDRAIPLLRQARLADSIWSLPAAWYEANSLLKKGRTAEARMLLRNLSETEGMYRERSQQLLEAHREGPE